MPDKKTIIFFMDTDVIRGTGFNSPNFQKLMRYSKERNVIIYVSRIVWSESLRQTTEEFLNLNNAVAKSLDKLNGKIGSHPANKELDPLPIKAYKTEDLRDHFRTAFETLAEENNIQIIEYNQKHADAAWQRYFDRKPPFRLGAASKNNRGHIPDSWILEAGIACLRTHDGTDVYGLCCDGNLKEVLHEHGMKFFPDAKTAHEVVDTALAFIEEQLGNADEPEEAAEIEAEEIAEEIAAEDQILQNRGRHLEKKILGLVAALGQDEGVTHGQLSNLMGGKSERALAVAYSLAEDGLIEDTGHHFLPVNSVDYTPYIEQVSDIMAEIVVGDGHE